MEQQTLPEKLYYIQDSRSYHGNAVIWWGIDGGGYTSDITKAGKYTYSKAKKICERNTDIAWEVEYIDSNMKAKKTIVDMQYLEHAKSGL